MYAISSSIKLSILTNYSPWRAVGEMDRVGYSACMLLNPRPPACKAGDLPLIYRPLTKH